MCLCRIFYCFTFCIPVSALQLNVFCSWVSFFKSIPCLFSWNSCLGGFSSVSKRLKCQKYHAIRDWRHNKTWNVKVVSTCVRSSDTSITPISLSLFFKLTHQIPHMSPQYLVITALQAAHFISDLCSWHATSECTYKSQSYAFQCNAAFNQQYIYL